MEMFLSNSGIQIDNSIQTWNYLANIRRYIWHASKVEIRIPLN